MKNCAIIIPVLNPTISLVDYVHRLLAEGAAEIIVINDGSKEDLTYIFTELSVIKHCTVLTHDINKGKGRALKTAFEYFLKTYQHLKGVVTADADGQHTVEDVCKIARALENNENDITLGVRDFSDADVPFRSLLGNRITSFFFQFLYGSKLKDTQTGLRGIPTIELPRILEIKGERYEYEINMLIYANKKNIPFNEISIQTLYFDNNASSHYHSVFDSIKIFTKLLSGFLRYFYSTILSGVIDISSFILLNNVLLVRLPLEVRIFFAIFVSRVLSSSSNFYMNRTFVFSSQNKLTHSIFKYYLLCIGIMLASYALVASATIYMGMNVILAKICIDLLLGIISHQIQLYWVFKNDNNTKRQVIGERNER
ncbi:glycosyltransferase [Peribacillus loiseleuriae]|uniref:glycosyltransferase n=1 Tax=Peribacillus loiseleuriae TaxID=1679170 RepID=UPI0038125776